MALTAQAMDDGCLAFGQNISLETSSPKLRAMAAAGAVVAGQHHHANAFGAKGGNDLGGIGLSGSAMPITPAT
jgi:hypothetical protein